MLVNKWMSKGCLAEFGVTEKVRWMGTLEDGGGKGEEKNCD